MKLFISYAHVDKRYVRELVEVLQTAGYESWFDHHLVAGKAWEAQLYEAIRQSDAFIYALTPESAISEWCLWEWKQAVSLGKPIIPVLLQAKTKFPEGLDKIQYVDLSDGVTGTAVAHLTRALNTAQIMNREVLPTIPDHPQGTPAQVLQDTQPMPIFTPQPRRYLGWGLILGFLLVGAVVGLFAWQTMQEDSFIPNETHAPSLTKTLDDPRTPTFTLIPRPHGNWTPTLTYILTVSQYISAGNANYKLERYTQSLADYNRAIELDPEYRDAYIYRGLAYRALGNDELALIDYNRAIELDPQYAATYNNRGLVYYALGEDDLALADYNRAIELDPQYALAYYNRGFFYAELGEYEQAIINYAHAIELDPGYRDAYNNRGNAYSVLGESDLALADYSLAIELDPEYAPSYSNRGNTYRALGLYEQSLVDYNRAIELDTENAAFYYNRGNAYRALEDHEQAIADYSRAIELDPEYARAYNNRGLMYYDLRDYEQAIADYSRAIELNSENANPYWGLGHIYYDQERWKEALATYQRYLELARDDADPSVIDRVAELEGRLAP